MINFALHRALPLLPVLAIFGVFAGPIWATQPAPPAKAPTQSVQIRNFAFVPAMLTVAPGTTVIWTNADEDPHSVVSTTKSFRSGALDTDGKFSFTFTHPGVYAYFCSLHPHMTAKIVVRSK